MPEQKINMVLGANTTRDAFGVSGERKAEILKKLIAVAKIYPKYSIILESFLNCEDRFTEMERLYGIFELGKISGSAALMRKIKMRVEYNSLTMPLEAKLLALMSDHVKVIDPLLDTLMKEGKKA